MLGLIPAFRHRHRVAVVVPSSQAISSQVIPEASLKRSRAWGKSSGKTSGRTLPLCVLWQVMRVSVLLVRPPDAYYDGPDGLRVAWLESAAERIPQETLERVPEGGIPLEDLTGALKGTRFEGAAQACSWVLAETGNFFLDHNYEDGSYDGFADPWDDDIIAEGTEEWRKANALMDAVSRLTDWLEEDLPGRFAEMLAFVLERVPEQPQQEQEVSDDK